MLPFDCPQFIKKNFPSLNISKIKIFLVIVELLIKKKTCCLYKLSDDPCDGTTFESFYAKLIRFFKIQSHLLFTYFICNLILLVVQSSSKHSYLILDRTNWKIGKKNVNILVLGVVYRKVCYIPLVWKVLDKRGNSNQEERIALLDTLLTLIKDGDYKYTLLGDREFIGLEWIAKLVEVGISFIIRLRNNTYLKYIKTKKKVKELKKHIKKEVLRKGFFISKLIIDNKILYYIALPDRQEKDGFIAFLSDNNDYTYIQNMYAKRWKIEVFFKHIKTNGFNFEDLNISKIEKINLFMAVVSFAYLMAVEKGINKESEQEIKMKKSKGKEWKKVSTFRLGLRNIVNFQQEICLLFKKINITNLNYDFLKQFLPKKLKSV